MLQTNTANKLGKVWLTKLITDLNLIMHLNVLSIVFHLMTRMCLLNLKPEDRQMNNDLESQMVSATKVA